MKQVVWALQTFAVVLISFPLAVLPCRAGDLLGLLLFSVWKSRREIAIENVRRSSLSTITDPKAVVRESFRNYGRSFMEIIKVYYGLGGKILDRITIQGLEHIQDLQAEGKAALLITGHCGNWELLAIACSYKAAPISVVVRPLNNPYLNRLLERARGRYGNVVIYKKGALREIRAGVKKGRSIGILMDQAVVAAEGYVIDFLGRGAWTTKMPALLARKTGVAVLPAFIRRTGEGHEILVYPEVRLSSKSNPEEALMEDTRELSRYIERHIRENPSEWLWIHRRWKRVPEGDPGCLEARLGDAA